MIKIRAIAFFFFCSFSTHALSLDCNIVNKASEKIICASEELTKLDKELNDTYTETLKNLSPAAQKKIKSEQRDWIKSRDFDENITEAILTQMYENRISSIKNFTYNESTPQPSPPKGIAARSPESKTNASENSPFSIKINLGWIIGAAFMLGILTFSVIALALANRRKQAPKTESIQHKNTDEEPQNNRESLTQAASKEKSVDTKFNQAEPVKTKKSEQSIMNEKNITELLYSDLELAVAVADDESPYEIDEERQFEYEDGVVITTSCESIESAELWLELLEEMELLCDVNINGTDFNEPEAIQMLEEEGNMFIFACSFQFPDGSEATLRWAQFSDGIQAGYKVELAGDLNVDSVLQWTQKVQEENLKAVLV